MDECNTKFRVIIQKCVKIENTIEKLEKKIKELQQKFQSASNHELNPLLVYSLDSVFFQFYVCNIQMENFLKVFDLIQNHIYCDLFKLHRILCDYVSHNIHDKKINALLNAGSYPVYKDLEKYRVYERDMVISLFDNIISIIKAIQEYCKNGTNEFKKHRESIENGFHYDKLLQTFHFNNRVIEEQVSLFSNFLKYSCNYHAEFLQKIYQKIYDLYYEIPPLFTMGIQKKALKMKKDKTGNKEDNSPDNEEDNKREHKYNNDIVSLTENSDEDTHENSEPQPQHQQKKKSNTNSDFELYVNYINNDDASSLFDEDSENMALLQQQLPNNELFDDLQIADDIIPSVNENDETASVVSSISASSEKKKRGRPKKIKK